MKQIRFPLIPSILLNYLLLNFWLVKNDNSNISNYDSWIFENTSAWFLLLLVNVVFISLLLLGKIRLNNDVNYYIAVIGIFQFLNIRNISSSTFGNQFLIRLLIVYLGSLSFLVSSWQFHAIAHLYYNGH